MIINSITNRIEKIIFKKLFPLWQYLGFHITKNHYYEPIPDTRSLKEELWQYRSELAGIKINEERQLDLLVEFVSKLKYEYERMLIDEVGYGSFNSGTVDGEILYCMIRYFKPRNIFEIGSGDSTRLSAKALLKNKEENNNDGCEFVAIDPYPSETLRGGIPGLSKLLSKKAQDIPLSEFNKLKSNDILFIDSSHVLKIGSDVQYEYLDILPRLNKGVIVHIHDIFLPAEYRKEWVLKDYRFWNEQYLLQAFLIFNDWFEILWAGSYMHLNYPDKLEAAFRLYKRDKRWPGSFWIRKIK
jgi:predicted O-methyltransferase YrrM